eukprot:COSAG05_NODE_19432_length_293_cov_0.221649_1_plen_34_part_10
MTPPLGASTAPQYLASLEMVAEMSTTVNICADGS